MTDNNTNTNTTNTTTNNYLSIYQPNLFLNKVAFVTGGGSGICYEMTLALMQLGCHAVIVSRNQTKLEKAASKLQSLCNTNNIGQPQQLCIPIVADVRNPNELIHAVNQTLQQLNRIDIVIAGAAGNFLAPMEKLSYNAYKTIIDIDLIGTYNTIKACLEPLKVSKGCIINVSATLQYTGSPLQVHAASAKNGIDAMTRVLAMELGRYGIRVNAIAPGPIKGTEGMTRLLPSNVKSEFINTIPIKRIGTVQDIGNATIFLASDAGSYITGAILVVDGGSWMTSNSILCQGIDNMLQVSNNINNPRPNKL